MSASKLVPFTARKTRNLVTSCCLLLVFFVFNPGFAQTKGLIVKPASTALAGQGRAVLDPNGDGYVSNLTSKVQLGFQANDLAESEIPYRPLPLPMAEPMNDLARGPKGGFSDFADMSGTVYPVSSYLSTEGNLMFRFRLGGIAPNSKGYSILVDADGKFGFTGPNADPEASVDNPGFEFEILLATNFAVRIYDVNNATGTATQKGTDADLPYSIYAQKAIAFTTNSGDADYFYDFYLPFSKITQYFPTVTTATPLRMVANTIMAPQSAIKGPISDIGGVDDKLFSSTTAAWQRIVSGFVPTAANGTTSTEFPVVKTQAPVVNNPLTVGGTTISGTSTEAAGTVISIYKNGSLAGTATVSASGTWTFATSALTLNDRYTATASASGKSVSDLSNEAIVQGNCTYSTTPVMGTCTGIKGLDGTVPGAAANTLIKIYGIFDPLTPITTASPIYTGQNTSTLSPAPTAPNTAFIYKANGSYSNCTSGSSQNMPDGSYYTTATESGKCESGKSALQCFGSNGTTSQPTLTQATITQSTTTLSGTITSAAGTKILLFVNGIYKYQTTVNSGTAWSLSGLTFIAGQNVEIYAIASSGMCASTAITRTVINPSVPPVVTGPIRTNATTISGTSTEPAGTVINVYQNGVLLSGSAIVSAAGTWTYTIPGGTTLAVNNTITATATAPYQSASPVSNTVAVTAVPAATPAVPNVTLNGGLAYKEGQTSVTGTGPVSTTINVYIDGYLLGTTTSNSSGGWTLTGLSATFYDLYTGGRLTATSGTIGSNESAQSNSTAGTEIIVECIPPASKTVSAVSNPICEGSSASFKITDSEDGVIYTMSNGSASRGISTLGTGPGTTIFMNTYPLTATETFTVTAQKVTGGTCSPVTINAGTLTVNPAPNASKAVTAPESIAAGSSTNVVVGSSDTNYLYQLRKETTSGETTTITNVGSPVTGNGVEINLPTGALTGETTFSVEATDVTRSTNCTRVLNTKVTVKINPLPVSLLTFTGRAIQNGTLLEWKTASEKNNARFEIEKSSDGKNFRTLGKVAGAVNSSEIRNYNFFDQDLQAGIRYYRLKQVDLDGTFEYSKIIAIDGKNLKTELASVYPNPAAGNSTLVLIGRANESAELVITNVTGQVVYRSNFAIKAGANQIDLPTENLPAGLYIIQVADHTNLKLQKVTR